jgi:DNA binding domain protein, excisionase family
MTAVKEPKFERMLTVTDVCKYLSVTNETVYSWIKRTDIPALRVGKRWLFNKAELDQWIKDGKGADGAKRGEQ